MTTPLPSYRARWALAPNGFSNDWVALTAPNAKSAAEQLLERADALGKTVMPSVVYVEVEPANGKPLRFCGHAGMAWMCEEVKKWDGNNRKWNQKGDGPL